MNRLLVQIAIGAAAGAAIGVASGTVAVGWIWWRGR